ncbi:hypothetical protein [Bacillus sp. UNC438CL73TsuS30]|uniref:hypothetical protein n=1 Tax=Bacillus sp. UNC438CL73TsuS30 TaxID=1340434 RepID=UPI000479F7BE|nr:hypothetical protein [Bacillus sp. UNC438CL73TsuS30]
MNEVNLQELEEKYGEELVEFLSQRIEQAEKDNHGTWKIKVLNESKVFPVIVFLTSNYTWICEIYLPKKRIENKYILSLSDTEELIVAMNSLKKA